MVDPMVEIEEGEFSHGGIRRFTHWLLEGQPTVRSKADSRRIDELGPNGRILWQETVNGPYNG
jgi:hypothetical protein